MRKRVKGESSLPVGGVVTHSVCGVAMGTFMYRKRNKSDYKSYYKKIKTGL